MAKIEKPKIRITFVPNGKVICESYERTDNGIHWVNGTIHGYCTHELIKKIEENI